MLTPEELKLAEDLGDIWNRFIALPSFAEADSHDFCFHIHALQNLIMARSAVRAHPEYFVGQDETDRSAFPTSDLIK